MRSHTLSDPDAAATLALTMDPELTPAQQLLNAWQDTQVTVRPEGGPNILGILEHAGPSCLILRTSDAQRTLCYTSGVVSVTGAAHAAPQAAAPD